jgi:DNA-binding protein YbaB
MTSSRWEPPGQNGQIPPGADEQVGRYAEMKNEIAAIKASVTSSDKAVTAVAGPAGSVLDIQVSEQALRSGSAKKLSSSIMSALRLAVADVARQQAEIVQRYVGDRLNIRDRVMAAQQELLGDKIEAGEQEQQRLAEQSRPAPEEDGGSVLRSVSQQPAPRAPEPHAPAPQPSASRPPAPPAPAPQPGVTHPRQRPAEDYDDNDDYDPFAWR